MTISDQITRIQNNIEDSYEACEEKGADMPSLQNSANLPETIRSITGGGSSYTHPILTTMWSDHILNDISWLRADTFSWHSGELYDAVYKELVREWSSEGAKATLDLSNVTIQGDVVVTDGIATNFNATSYIVPSTKLNNVGNNKWEINIRFKYLEKSTNSVWLMGDTVDRKKPCLGVNNGKFVTFISSNGESWDIAERVTSDNEIPVNTFCYARMKFTGTQYIVSHSADGTTYTDDIVISSSSNINSNDYDFVIGYSVPDPTQSFNDGYAIDLAETNISINGTQTWDAGWSYKSTPKGYHIAAAGQESRVLEKYNTNGIAWYYILDTTNKRFKLPRTKFGFEGLRTNAGDDIAESLPNIKGNTGNAIGDQNPSGAIYTTFVGNYPVVSSGYTWERFGTEFNASRSSSTYQDNAPVQERATQMYLYFYVGEYPQETEEQIASLEETKADKTEVALKADKTEVDKKQNISDGSIYTALEYSNNVSGSIVVPLKDTVIQYAYDVNGATSFTFDTSALTSAYKNSKVITFEMRIGFFSAVQSISFLSNVVWLNGKAPDLSKTGAYHLAFRTYPGWDFWLGSLEGKEGA